MCARRRSRHAQTGSVLIEERIELAGRELSLLRPPSADELIDEEAFAEDEFLPYWAELWPSGVALARAVAALDLEGARVLELGAGLGLPSLAAALRGAEVLATDWAADAVELLRANAARNGIELRAERVRWDEPEPLLREAPWQLVLGADLLYERRNADLLLELLPRLVGWERRRPSRRRPAEDGAAFGGPGAEVLLAEPGRPFARSFLAHWDVEEVAERVYRLR